MHAGGSWNIRPAALPDGARTVTASVTDPAGNQGSDSQLLTVDTAAPAVSIAGGATALTNDPTPDISGSASVVAGTIVSVTLADETLTGSVGGGTWTVTAGALSDGPHRVVMSTADAAGNAASFSQVLTVDTVSPGIAIGGGATRTTSDLDPTIAGTSDAAPNTIVTVSIAGQTMTTLLQANGTWNATPTVVGLGVWPVAASAPDPAGNVGTAAQTLTIAPAGADATGETAGTGPGGGTPPAATAVPPATPTPTPIPATTTSASADGGPASAVSTTTVAPNASQKVAGFVLSIGTKVTAPAKGAVTVTASGVVRIKGVRKAIKLATATQKVAAGRSLTLRLKPAGSKKVVRAAFAKIKSAVGKGKTVTATISLKIVDGAGHTRRVTRTVRLTK